MGVLSDSGESNFIPLAPGVQVPTLEEHKGLMENIIRLSLLAKSLECALLGKRILTPEDLERGGLIAEEILREESKAAGEELD